MAGFKTEVAADGVHLFGFKVQAQLLEIFEPCAAGQLVTAVAQLADVFLLWGVVFVFNIADDFFDNVLDGHQTGRAAVFVNGNGDMIFARAEFLEQLHHDFGFRHEEGGPHDAVYGSVLALRIEHGAQKILGVGNTDDVVARFRKNRQPGMACLDDVAGGFQDRRAGRDTVKIRAGRHDVLHLEAVQLENPENHGSFFSFQFAIVAGFHHRVFQVIAAVAVAKPVS